MKKKLLQYLVMFLIALPIINAASIAVDSPQYIIEAETASVNFSINSVNFSGTVTILYTNINSTIVSVPFSNGNFVGDHYNYSWNVKGSAAGDYSIYASVANSSGDVLAVYNKTGTVNSSIPKVFLSSPSGTLNKDTQILIVKTSEIATCKYDSGNTSYGNMSSTFANTNSIWNNQTLTGLSEGEHSYFVRCTDANGFTMNEPRVIKFTVDLPPSASIKLSDKSPVKAGTIEVTVTTSENIDNTPTLEYAYNDAPSTKKQISLTGSGSSWKGYLIITEADNNKVGTFYFSALDSAGNTGNKITSDSIFVVDTLKPVSAQSVKAASNSNGDIELSWYYDGEDANYFNVYRSTSAGVNYVDFYEKSENESRNFLDESNVNKATYYYRISAVDNAGNEGPLSEEVYATSVNSAVVSSQLPQSSVTQDTTPKVLPPNLVPIVSNYIKTIDKTLIDISDILVKIEAEDAEKKALLDEFKVKEQLQAARAKLEDLSARAEGLKDEYATRSELEDRINSIDLEVKKIENTVPKNVMLLEKSEFIQSTSPQDVENAVNEVMKSIAFTPEEKSEYLKKNQKEKDKIKVSVSVRVISIEYLNGDKKEKSIVKKKLTYENPEALNDVLVIETIPKSIAERYDEIEFITQNYNVLEEDPIIKFGFLKFDFNGETIEYHLSKRISADDVKNSKSVVLISPNQMVEINKVTGNSIFGSFDLSTSQSVFIWGGMLSIIMLSGYYFLYVKNYRYAIKGAARSFKRSSYDGEGTDEHHDLPGLPEIGNRNSLIESNSLKVNDMDSTRLLNEIYLHIKDSKGAVSDKLLPLFVKLNNKLETQGFKNASIGNSYNNNVVFLNALIDKAHEHIDGSAHSEAVKLYPKIDYIYKNLPKEAKAEIYQRCAHLHRRISHLKPMF